MKQIKRILRYLAYILIFIALIVGAIAVAYSLWYTHRPRPDDTSRQLFDGITYTRDVREEPRPIIIHVVKIDLPNPNISFLVTPHTDNPDDPELMFPAQTTSDFLAEYDLQLAINADFFEPWWSNTPWDYYPHAGDFIGTRGLSASLGKIATYGYVEPEHYTTLYLSKDNQATFTEPESIYNAVSGLTLIVEDGQSSLIDTGDKYLSTNHPRTIIALDEDEEKLIIIVIDGRQPNYSEGVNLIELAELSIEYGAYTALNLDGGGSTTLVIEDEDGNPQTLNSPIHGRIPGRERPIANHLGVYVD